MAIHSLTTARFPSLAPLLVSPVLNTTYFGSSRLSYQHRSKFPAFRLTCRSGAPHSSTFVIPSTQSDDYPTPQSKHIKHIKHIKHFASLSSLGTMSARRFIACPKLPLCQGCKDQNLHVHRALPVNPTTYSLPDRYSIVAHFASFKCHTKLNPTSIGCFSSVVNLISPILVDPHHSGCRTYRTERAETPRLRQPRRRLIIRASLILVVYKHQEFPT